jgi:hypothetical protein
MKVRFAAALMLATLALSILTATQSANLSGTWALEAPAASGPNYQLGAVSGTLTLEDKDSVVTGTWKGSMPEPWTLTGRVKGNTFELETEVRNLSATKDGEQTSVPRRWVFRGSADGDKITGKMGLSGGEGEEPTRSFSAVRKR